MHKLLTAFIVLFLGCVILSAVMEGGGGLAATELTADIDDNDVTIPVVSTAWFLDGGDYAVIGDETFSYTGTAGGTSFTGVTRGVQGTTAVAHSDGEQVRTLDSNITNTLLGYSIAVIWDNWGILGVPNILIKFFTVTVPRLTTFDFSFFEGQLVIIRYFFLAIGAGLIITLVFTAAGRRAS